MILLNHGSRFIPSGSRIPIIDDGLSVSLGNSNVETTTFNAASGKSLFLSQLVHAGGQTDSRNAGRQPFAPSAVQIEQFPEVPQELSKEDIAEIVTAFGDAAKRAKSYDFDAVQLHGAHGYLINQFLSPHINKRTDEYGGSIENRCRFLMEVYRKVREAVGNDYPVMIKLTGSDFLEGGLSSEEAVFAAKNCLMKEWMP